MFGPIVLDPRIFCELDSIRWGQRVGSEYSETFHSCFYFIKVPSVDGVWGRSRTAGDARRERKRGERNCRILFFFSSPDPFGRNAICSWSTRSASNALLSNKLGC